MMVLFTCALLFISFFAHLLWWHVKMPVRTSRALLLIFLVVPIITFSICKLLGFPFTLSMSLPEIVSLFLFYTSCTLVYICLYSAIEQHSPTLTIITHIDEHGESGCEDNCVVQHLNPNEEIHKRLSIMKQVGWIQETVNNYILTKRGKRIATIFGYGATIFGLKKGG